MHAQTVEQVLAIKASDELISVPAAATVADAVEVMAARHVGAVVIKTEDGLVGGIFTERDLLVRVVHAGRDPKSTPISLVMTRDVRFVTPGTTVEAALSLIHVNRHRHLLVIDGPPWTLNPFVRGRAEQLFERIVPGGIVLLDDAARPGERVVAGRWRRDWPNFRFTLLPGAKGTLVGERLT